MRSLLFHFVVRTLLGDDGSASEETKRKQNSREVEKLMGTREDGSKRGMN